MSGTLDAAFVCYTLGALLSAVFGVIYLTSTQFMPYHQDAVGLAWGELDSRMQTLLLALMRVSGGGFLATALSIIFMLFFPFYAGEEWSKYAIPMVGLAEALPALYAALLVRRRTPASPPLWAGLLAAALIVLGFVLSMV